MAPRASGAAANVSAPLPYFSHSRVSRYLHCPAQYKYYYVERLRPRLPDAALIFGQVVHQALAALFRTGEDPTEFFRRSWEEVRSVDLTYGARESWEGLAFTGRTLLAKFLREEVPKLRNVTASERSFSITVTTLGVPFVGIVDLVAELDGRRTVVDFKTAAAATAEHEAALSDQLTAYQLAEPDAEQAAFCVLVKTQQPRVEWHVSERQPAQVVEYLGKAELVAGTIARGEFYKRPGRWCGYCDYLPLCVGDNKRADETLVRVAPTTRP